LQRVEDLNGVYNPLEHLGEGSLGKAFQSLLETLQKTATSCLTRSRRTLMPR
jgi:hypothetical protein